MLMKPRWMVLAEIYVANDRFVDLNGLDCLAMIRLRLALICSSDQPSSANPHSCRRPALVGYSRRIHQATPALEKMNEVKHVFLPLFTL